MNIKLYWLFHALFSLLFIFTFVSNFGYPFETIIIHFCVLISLNVLLLYLNFVVSKWVKAPRARRIIRSLVMTLYWFYLVFIYFINWYSNVFWGGNVMAGFIVDLPLHMDSISRLYEFPVWVIYGLCGVLFTVAYFLVAKVVKLLASIRKVNHQLTALVMFLICSYFYLTASSNHLIGKWGFEPIISSFLHVDATYNSVRSSNQRIKDHIVRQGLQSQLDEVDSKTNVVLIMADALRPDHMPIYGYSRPTTPFLDSIQNQLQKMEAFTATCSESVCSIISALASREYFDIGFGLYDVSDVLKDAGYLKYFLLGANHHWNNLEKLYGNNHDVYKDGASRYPKMSMYDDEAITLNLQELPDYKDQPAFFYFHLISTHQIGVIHPEFEKFQPAVRELSKHASFQPVPIDPKLREALINGYDNGVYQMDHYVGEIFQWLEVKGYLDDAIVIITADHGEGLGKRGLYYHTYQLYQEDLAVPMLVYDTSGKCQLNNTRYGSLVDLAPTILDCLDLPEVSTYQGISLLDKPPATRYSFHQTIRTREVFALVRESSNHMYKLMVNRLRDKFYNFRLYDIYHDPLESENIITSVDHELLKEMLEVFREKLQLPETINLFEQAVQN